MWLLTVILQLKTILSLKKVKGSFSEFVGKKNDEQQPLSASKTSAYRERCGVELGKF